ncbi:TIGR03751 family conjugal transfer lipoprotein [Diaphorobacter sp. HDW4A]|uniref:TIGR03751 family conjugal transfer lipoprotein n=1 Tax=Diaphorobacter sp. HDW4A TaxID=2714924 RepID=UPI00140B59D7|nr:TIGR03751 family conjugal transfer lipoprotein [Diaphorobacter sp. HDW4A]QIL80332.1 TIGR03751 family conjugal transfer lipoprotein [Diaphorobacter sp. HDW4A]
MDLNKRTAASLNAAFWLMLTAITSACTVMTDRESPINAATRGSPSVLDVYRGTDGPASPERKSARERMRESTSVRPVKPGDEQTQKYWSALDPMNQRFARIPNPDLVMVVYPHLAKGQYPVPGYVTVFPMYEQTQYALPGEVSTDLLAWRSEYVESQTRATEKPRTTRSSNAAGGSDAR